MTIDLMTEVSELPVREASVHLRLRVAGSFGDTC